MQSDSFLANLEQIPKAHPNAFIEAAKTYLAMLPLVFNCKKHKVALVFCVLRSGRAKPRTD